LAAESSVLDLPLGRGEIKAAPVDTNEVTAALENGLFLGSCSQNSHTGGGFLVPSHRLVGLVEGQQGAGVNIELNLVWLAVAGAHLPSQVSHWPGQHVQIVEQGRGHKSHVDPNPGVLELGESTQGQHLHRHLPQRGDIAWFNAHQAERTSVHPDEAV
jgi:hypothetical protein